MKKKRYNEKSLQENYIGLEISKCWQDEYKNSTLFKKVQRI